MRPTRDGSIGDKGVEASLERQRERDRHELERLRETEKQSGCGKGYQKIADFRKQMGWGKGGG